MRTYLPWILGALLLTGCGGGSGSSSGSPVVFVTVTPTPAVSGTATPTPTPTPTPGATPTPTPGPDEFTFVASNAGIDSVPITNDAQGSLGTSPGPALSSTGAESIVLGNGGKLLYAANGSETINSLSVDPIHGTLTPVNSTIGVAVGGNGPSFQLKSLGLDAADQNLLAASSGASVQDVQVFPLNADGSFGTPSEVLTSAQLGATPNGLATTASGGTTLVAIPLQQASPNLLLTTFSNGSVGTVVPVTAGTNATSANAVAFGAASGQPVVYAVTTESDGSGTLTAIPLTVSGTNVSAGTAAVTALPVKGQSVAADGAGHIYAGIHFTDHNVFGFTFTPGTGLAANGTAVSTVTPGNPGDILLDPSGKLAWLMTINDLGNSQNLTVFPLDLNGSLGAAGTATSVGNAGQQLAGVKF
ncbi:MAG: lactonase family protein [Candidatus Xenobia bacterium]